jgi:hypothetical protein
MYIQKTPESPEQWAGAGYDYYDDTDDETIHEGEPGTARQPAGIRRAARPEIQCREPEPPAPMPSRPPASQRLAEPGDQCRVLAPPPANAEPSEVQGIRHHYIYTKKFHWSHSPVSSGLGIRHRREEKTRYRLHDTEYLRAYT